MKASEDLQIQMGRDSDQQAREMCKQSSRHSSSIQMFVLLQSFSISLVVAKFVPAFQRRFH